MTEIKTQQSLFTIPTNELEIGENYTYVAKVFYTKVSRIRWLTMTEVQVKKKKKKVLMGPIVLERVILCLGDCLLYPND